VISSPCGHCQGQGTRAEEVSLDVPIPLGVATGHKLRLDGDGHAGTRGGEAGDLYILMEVEDHPFFERDGDDISCEVPITFPQAALGTSVVVPTLYGKAKVKVPPGTQSSNRLRLRGKGLPKLRGRGKGDQFVRLQIETPVKLTARQKALLEEFQGISDEAEGRETQPRQRSFLDRLKEFFG
jgi:molecular chaperone DnaJ